MSGRGTITSRATVSPNVKIEWISSRSCGSMLPSSCPTSAIVRMTSSETKGPSLRPLPRSRIAVQDAEGLRHRLDHHEVDDGESHRDQRDAEAAEIVLGDDGDEDGGAVLREHDAQVDRVEIPRWLSRDALEERRVTPALRLERHCPDAGHATERALGHGQHGSEEDE